MKNDAVTRMPRAAWELGRAFARETGRDLREVLGVATEEYVEKERALGRLGRKAYRA